MPKKQALKVCDYPQLRFLAWSLNDEDTMEEGEAFALYERSWRFVDQVNLKAPEKQLIARLTQQYGNGLLNV